MPHEESYLPNAVYKVGGSLLGLPDLASRLGYVIRDFTRPRPIVICGGGESVEALRRWDRNHNLDEETCHWLALRALSITSRVLEQVVPGTVVVDSPDDLAPVWAARKCPIYDPYHFIVDVDEFRHDPLPRRWRVTSDSIAARVAEHFQAEELILVKSINFPERMSLEEAAEERLVDPHFPTAAANLPRVVAINLRSEEPEERLLYADWTAGL